MTDVGWERAASRLGAAALLLGAACSSASAPERGWPDEGGTDAAPPGVDAASPGDAAVPPHADAGVAAGDAGAGFDAPPEASIDPTAEAMHVRADAALATLMLEFWSQLASNTTTYDWMYAHYWDAVLDATERRGPNAFTGTAKMFFELQARRGWLDGFYDDENWITLALLHAYRVTGDATYLAQAKTVYADIMNAWDTTCCGSHPGGMYWQKPATSKVTAINAGAVVSGARLYAATQDGTYLDFAKKVYAFWSTNMVDASTGHVYDGEDNAGTINTAWSFTYNEGLFIGAIVELSKVTGDTSHLPLAHQAASYMMSHESETTPQGTILSDGKCSGDGEMFKGVGARYLRELYEADPSHTEYRDFLHRSADSAWNAARDPATGNVSCDWLGPYDSTTGVVGSLGSAEIGLASAAMALGPGLQRPPLTYEAEEGDLHGVGLEARYGAFSGWAYLAGWGSDGQSVDLLVDVPTARDYTLTFRYATGSDATRSVSVDGTAVSANLTFPGTGGYTTYATVSTTAPLPAGRSTITVAFIAANGSGNYLNLDNLVLAPH